MLRFKTIHESVKDLDNKGRTVTGYFSAFDNVDADGDVIVKGAFSRTLRERGPQGKNRIMHLWQHDPYRPIGKPSVLQEDDKGLYFETYLHDTTLGNDTLKLYEAGIINEHSIGFRVVGEPEERDGVSYLKEIMLWEGSSVTWGANEETPAAGVKALFTDDTTLQAEIDRIQKFLRKGDVTDDTFHMLEYKLEQLKLIPVQADEPEPVQSEPSEILKALQSINLKRDIRYGRFPETSS